MATDSKAHFKELVSGMQNLGGEIPETIAGFKQLHKAAMADGALSTKVKELIALAIGINVRCDGCIVSHVRSAVKAGATREEIAEAIGVSVLMGGGPATVYGAKALEAADQFMQS